MTDKAMRAAAAWVGLFGLLTLIRPMAASASAARSRPADAARPAPEKRIRLDYRDTDISRVLQAFSIAAGKTLITAPGLAGPVTILNPQPIPLAQAFQVLDAVLQRRGYRLEADPLLLRVVPAHSAASASAAAGEEGGLHLAREESRPPREERSPQVEVLKLQAASATQVARIINDLFRPAPTAGRGAASARSRFQPAASRNDTRRRGRRAVVAPAAPVVRASADEYTNSVAVVAPPAIADDIRRMVAQLDHKSPPNTATRIFRLQYARAEELAPEVSQVLLGVAPATAGGGRLQGMSLERRVRLTSRVGSLNATLGEVVPDARTNSLVVSTTAENLARVENLLRRLDAPAHARPTTLLLPLQNARATDIAPLLNETFSPTTRGGSTAPRTFGNTTRRQPNANRPRANGRPRPAPGR